MCPEFDLQFADAQARLSCGFDRDGANRFVIQGSDGVLRLEAPFLKAQSLMRFTRKGFDMMPTGKGTIAKVISRLPLPGRKVRRFPFPGNGLQFEAAAVMEAVRAWCDRRRDHAIGGQRRGPAHHRSRAGRKAAADPVRIRTWSGRGRAAAGRRRCSAPARSR